MMRKIECKIVTFYNAINYGAVLQTFALKQKMSSFCHTSIYKHTNRFIEKMYSINPFKEKSIKPMIVKSIYFPIRLIRNYRFNRFVNKYILNTVAENLPTFYVTGSDQVFNCFCTDFDKTYFLDFVSDSKCKNSYAGSFGLSRIPEEYQAEYAELLKDFNSISVRENTGKTIIKELIDRDVNVVLDPTLLLPKEEWASVLNLKTKAPKRKYVLVYGFIITPTMKALIEKLAKDENLEIIVLLPEKPLKGIRINGARYVAWVSPEKWVELFMGATYVVTNSFHGTAFSVNFNKNFFVELLPESSNVNSRMVDFLSDLNLSDRIMQQGSSIEKSVDFSFANSVLEIKRKESIGFLESIVNAYSE